MLDAVIDYSVALAVTNPASPGFGVNRATRQDDIQLITLGTDAQSVSCQEYWFRGRWFDNVTSTVPPAVLDAAASTMSVLKRPTVRRLEDGTFYGFERGEPGRRQRRGQLHPCLELRQRLAVPVPATSVTTWRQTAVWYSTCSYRNLTALRWVKRAHDGPPHGLMLR